MAEHGWSRRTWPKEKQRALWPHLTSQQVDLFKEVFDIFDTDGKGFFTSEELMEVMTNMGGVPSAAEVEGVLYEMDADQNRVVDFAEFLTKFYTCMTEEQILGVFNQLAIQQETTGDNKVLTMAVLEKCFAYVGDPLSEIDKRFLDIMFQGADKDGNGTLDINEFITYLEKLEEDMGMPETPTGGQRLSDALLSQQEANMRSSPSKKALPSRRPSLLGKVTEGIIGSITSVAVPGSRRQSAGNVPDSSDVAPRPSGSFELPPGAPRGSGSNNNIQTQQQQPRQSPSFIRSVPDLPLFKPQTASATAPGVQSEPVRTSSAAGAGGSPERPPRLMSAAGEVPVGLSRLATSSSTTGLGSMQRESSTPAPSKARLE